jgi:tetratricopeptide (TPR) repeat protein
MHLIPAPLTNRLVSDLIANGRKLIGEAAVQSVDEVRKFARRLFAFSPEVDEERRQIKGFLYQNVYYSPVLQRDKKQAEQVIIKTPQQLPASYQEKTRREPLHRIVCHYIAGMSRKRILIPAQKFILRSFSLRLAHDGRIKMQRIGCLLLVLVAACGFVLCSGAYGQSGGDDANRKKAFELFRQDKHLEALPLFEELALRNPDDRDVLLGLGVCLVAESATLDDQDTATKERLRARQVLLKAKKLGNTAPLLENMLQTIPEDGIVKFQNTPADQAMRAAEAAFAKHDFEEAIKNYSKVLEYDPKNYSAVLFIGDTYFTEKDWAKAGEWYQRAIDLDPNKETAHRYYADMLLKNGEVEKSRMRSIQAVVAEPYNPITWRGLQYWATASKLELKRVHVDTPNNVSQTGEKNITITMDPKEPQETSTLWLSYGLAKAGWRGDEFKKHFPAEKQYRHSLAEEAGALTLAATVWTEANESDKKKKKATSPPKDPNLILLLKLYQAKMIEPYVLLNAADDGIAQDYAGYREKNREKLEQYLSDFVVPSLEKP